MSANFILVSQSIWPYSHWGVVALKQKLFHSINQIFFILFQENRIFMQIKSLEDMKCQNLFSRKKIRKISSICHLLITFANSLDQIRPDKMSSLIWIQTICIPERFFEKINLKKKSPQMENTQHAKCLGLKLTGNKFLQEKKSAISFMEQLYAWRIHCTVVIKRWMKQAGCMFNS